MEALSAQDKIILYAFLRNLEGDIRDSLVNDIQSASVIKRSSDGLIVRFSLLDYDRPEYKGQSPYLELRFVHEGRMIDAILFQDQNRRLFELEIIPLNNDIDVARFAFDEAEVMVTSA